MLRCDVISQTGEKQMERLTFVMTEWKNIYEKKTGMETGIFEAKPEKMHFSNFGYTRWPIPC